MKKEHTKLETAEKLAAEMRKIALMVCESSDDTEMRANGIALVRAMDIIDNLEPFATAAANVEIEGHDAVRLCSILADFQTSLRTFADDVGFPMPIIANDYPEP